MYFYFCLFLLCTCAISFEIDYDYGSIDNHKENCVCVPYWQCKDDLSGLIDDGVDVIDIRIFKNPSEDTDCIGEFDVCCQIECGRSGLKPVEYFDSEELASRILGEHNEAEYAEFPWMLGILYNKAFRCGASLIHPQVAITAAHCVRRNEKYKVRAGEWNWKLQNEPLPHQNRMTSKIIIHPYYDPKTLRNDIAILILETPFKLAENVGIVCLPPVGTIFDGEGCIASGWGRTSFKAGTYSPTLKKINLPLIPNNSCLNILRKAALGPYFNLDKSFICAGQNKKDTCKGDGGSPLFCPIIDNPDRYEQVGIVSWGLTCGVYNAPGVYVNVALFRNWIDKQMFYNNFDTNIYTS